LASCWAISRNSNSVATNGLGRPDCAQPLSTHARWMTTAAIPTERQAITTATLAGGSAIQDHPREAALSPLNAVEGPVPVVPAGARGIDQDLIPNLQLQIMQFLHSHHTRKSVPPGWKLPAQKPSARPRTT
jgi:hypothetical protein